MMWFILLFTLINPLNATSFFEDHARGWHWYEISPLKTTKTTPKATVPTPPMTPSQWIQAYRKELYKRRDTALVSPTFENVKAYQVMQMYWMNKSQEFANTWKEVVFRTPQLDDTIQNPITQVTRHIYYDKKNHSEETLLKTLAKTHGLYFIFKRECAYCHQFAPIVKRFADTYGFTIVAINHDGDGGTFEFPDAISNNGILKKIGVDVVPSLYLINPKTDQTTPLAHGMVSMDDIKERLIFLIQREAKHS